MSSVFLAEIAELMYRKRYAKRTIDIYLKFIKAFIRFHQYKHPKTLHDAEVEAFLSHLVHIKDVSASTQALALNALVFLYKHVLHQPQTHGLGDDDETGKGSRTFSM